jgi:outer membrane biosynthesis protein TonB
MPPEKRQRSSRPRGQRRDEATFTRNLRYEMAGQEGRALIGSWTLSAALGVMWLLLVAFGPRTDVSHLLPPEERPINVTFEPPPPAPAPPTPPTPVAAAPKPTPAPVPRPVKPQPTAAELEAKRAAAMKNAFGAAAPTSGPVGDVSNVLRGVAVSTNAPKPGAAVGKSVLAYGQGGQGVRTPGREDMAAGAAGAMGAIGGVAGSAGIGHEGIGVSAPRAIDVPNLGGPSRDMGELGTSVRNHESQLRFCYDEYGLKVNPGLAGSVTIAITMTGSGAVTGAKVSRRTWSGPGSAETEACVLQRARAWNFPSSSAGGGTFEFSFNFTK